MPKKSGDSGSTMTKGVGAEQPKGKAMNPDVYMQDCKSFEKLGKGSGKSK